MCLHRCAPCVHVKPEFEAGTRRAVWFPAACPLPPTVHALNLRAPDPPPVSRPDCPRRVPLSPTPSTLPHRTPVQATGATHGADALADVLEMVRTHQVNMPGHICATGEQRFAACVGRGLHWQLAVGVARGVAAQCSGRAAKLTWLLRPLFWLKLPACLHACPIRSGDHHEGLVQSRVCWIYKPPSCLPIHSLCSCDHHGAGGLVQQTGPPPLHAAG